MTAEKATLEAKAALAVKVAYLAAVIVEAVRVATNTSFGKKTLSWRHEAEASCAEAPPPKPCELREQREGKNSAIGKEIVVFFSPFPFRFQG